jgi:hypothetical protein
LLDAIYKLAQQGWWGESCNDRARMLEVAGGYRRSVKTWEVS